MSSGSSTETLTGTEAVRAERARILSELLDDLDELADTAAATMRAEIPAYAAQDEAFHADVRDQVARHYRSKLAVLLEDRTVTLDDIAFTRRAAMRRARAGVALADYINAFRVGQQVFWESVVKRAGRSFAGHEAALSLAAPLMRYCDFASTHAANAYMEFQQYATAEAVRESRDLLETLLAGNTPTRGRQLAAAQAHGLGAGHPHAVARGDRDPSPAARQVGGEAVATGPDRGADARHAACAAIARTGGNGTRTLSVVRQSEIVAIPVARPRRRPRASCATGCRRCGRACSARASCWRWASAR